MIATVFLVLVSSHLPSSLEGGPLIIADTVVTQQHSTDFTKLSTLIVENKLDEFKSIAPQLTKKLSDNEKALVLIHATTFRPKSFLPYLFMIGYDPHLVNSIELRDVEGVPYVAYYPAVRFCRTADALSLYFVAGLEPKARFDAGRTVGHTMADIASTVQGGLDREEIRKILILLLVAKVDFDLKDDSGRTVWSILRMDPSDRDSLIRVDDEGG